MLARAAQIYREYGDIRPLLVYRKTGYSWGSDVPVYAADPERMARKYWEELLASWPQELRPDDVWVEFPNEPNKDSDQVVNWLGLMARAAGEEAIIQGYKYLSPGWAAGTPEPHHWETAGWIDYLELCHQYPSSVGISVHEYTLDPEVLMSQADRSHIGRCQVINRVCDQWILKHPKIVITEWGWGPNAAPPAGVGVLDVIETAQWYEDNIPNVMGGALWCLDRAGQWSGISQTISSYIQPLTALTIERAQEPPQEPPKNGDSPQTGKHKAIVLKIAQEATWDQWEEALAYAYTHRHTMTASHDDLRTILSGGNQDSVAIIMDPESPSQVETITMLEELGYKWRDMDEDNDFRLLTWPTDWRLVTQPWGVVHERYTAAGLPGHEGIDIKAPLNSPIYAAAPGDVTRAGPYRSDGSLSAYGQHIILSHEGGYSTIYGHLSPALQVKSGDRVEPGQLLGWSGNTGQSTGPHLHFTLMRSGHQTPGWPAGYIDPTEYLEAVRWVKPQEPLMSGWVWGEGLRWAGDGGVLAVTILSVNMRAESYKGAARLRIIEAGEPVQVIGIPINGYYPIMAHDPQPAPDLATYIMPERGAAVGDLVVLKNNWGAGDELSQLQWDLSGERARVLQVKNSHYEALYITDDKIYREEDTSPGSGEFYRIESESGWAPRRMKPGQTYTRTERVSFFSLGSCQPTKSPYTLSSDIRMEGLHPTWMSSHGVTLTDVIQLSWLSSAGQIIESYFYAPHLGLVGWSNNSGMSSSVSEIIPRGMAQGPTAHLIRC